MTDGSGTLARECGSDSVSYPFASEAVRPRGAEVREESVQPRLPLLQQTVTGRNRDQIHPVAVQRVTQQLTVVVNALHWTVNTEHHGKIQLQGGRSVCRK